VKKVNWELIVGFNGQTFDTGPDLSVGDRLGKVKVERQSWKHSSQTRAGKNTQHRTNMISAKTNNAVGRHRSGAGINANARAVAARGVGVGGGMYYTVHNVINQSSAKRAADRARKALEPKVVRWGMAPGSGGLLVVCLFQLQGPGRIFVNSNIRGPSQTKAHAIASFYRQGSISTQNSDVELWWATVEQIEEQTKPLPTMQSRSPPTMQSR